MNVFTFQRFHSDVVVRSRINHWLVPRKWRHVIYSITCLQDVVFFSFILDSESRELAGYSVPGGWNFYLFPVRTSWFGYSVMNFGSLTWIGITTILLLEATKKTGSFTNYNADKSAYSNDWEYSPTCEFCLHLDHDFIVQRNTELTNNLTTS